MEDELRVDDRPLFCGGVQGFGHQCVVLGRILIDVFSGYYRIQSSIFVLVVRRQSFD